MITRLLNSSDKAAVVCYYAVNLWVVYLVLINVVSKDNKNRVGVIVFIQLMSQSHGMGD